MGAKICIKCYKKEKNLLPLECQLHTKIDNYHCKDCINIFNEKCCHKYEWRPCFYSLFRNCKHIGGLK